MISYIIIKISYIVYAISGIINKISYTKTLDIFSNLDSLYVSHCQNSSKFLSIAYFMKTADVSCFFFLHMIGLIILVNGN